MGKSKRDELGRKRCYKCDSWLSESEFNRDASRPDGLSHICKACFREKRRTGKPTGRPRATLLRDEFGRKRCTTCKAWKPESDYMPAKVTADRLDTRCRQCESKRNNAAQSSSIGLFLRSLSLNHSRRKPVGSLRRKEMFIKSEVTSGLLKQVWDRQHGRCALTGEQMTHVRGKGQVPTNASIDRIDSDCGYTKQNIQLVCYAVNMMKRSMGESDLRLWCEKIMSYQTSGSNGNGSLCR